MLGIQQWCFTPTPQGSAFGQYLSRPSKVTIEQSLSRQTKNPSDGCEDEEENEGEQEMAVEESENVDEHHPRPPQRLQGDRPDETDQQ